MMPKGKKIDRGYATIDDFGIDYRTLAKIMTDRGEKMNHASARNYIMRVMRKIAADMCEGLNVKGGNAKIDEMATSPYFQAAICEMLQIIENENS